MEIVIILGLSLILRLIGLNQSMWLDEAISANVAKIPITKIIQNFSINDFHPPIHYWFLNIWIKIFGTQVWIMRLSSVLFSLVTIWLVYKIGQKLKNEKTGIWAAILVGVNPLLIYFSQELRMYSMVTMWLTGSIYFLIKILKKENWKDILGFNLLVGLSFLTFYGSIFLIAAELLYILINKKIKLFLKSSIGIILAIMIISPLLLTQLKNSGEMLDQVANWSLVLGKVNLKNLLLIPLKFSIGKISWWPKYFYYLIGATWSVVVFGLTIKGLIKNKLWRSLMIMPIIFGVIFSLKSPLLQYFRFLYLIPILALLLSMNKFKTKVFLMMGFLVFSLIYLLNPKMHREDWKSLTFDLTTTENIYMIESFSDPIKFYNPEIKVNDIKKNNPVEEKITVIPYGEEIHGVNHLEKLKELNYEKISENSLRGVSLEYWEKEK